LSSFQIAHISDLHFFETSTGIGQFFSKRWIGNLNFLLRRKKEFIYSLLDPLLPLLLEHKVPLVVISGDVSCTSLPGEFYKASLFIKKLQAHGIETIVLPGNHDQYTRQAKKNQLFYRAFPSELQQKGLIVKRLPDSWWFIAMDTTLVTPLFCCHGKFTKKLEHELEKALANLPEDAKVILANHFPIALKTDKALQRERYLIALLKRHPKIKLYLHGHTHRHRILDLRKQNLPILIDSGSVVHKRFGSWNLLECSNHSCTVLPFHWNQTHWIPEKKHLFTWERTL
jgi:3',5'-cyclic AMP phosphodiesterase CpdA